MRIIATLSYVNLLYSQERISKESGPQNVLRTLKCDIHNNIWGKVGSKSIAARLWAEQSPNFIIDEHKPYAELWIGTHKNGMSEIILQNEEDEISKSLPLSHYVQDDPKLHLGIKKASTHSTTSSGVARSYELSFLLKVLSIEKTLAIQAHPDKYLARQLHRKFPRIYPDSNHKPEMALAISDDFEALVGFRPISEIADNLLEYPEFSSIVGGKATSDIMRMSKDMKSSHDPQTLLRNLMHKYMTADKSLVETQLVTLIERLNGKDKISSTDKLILKFSEQYPGDSGIFGPIIFNHLKLNMGEAVYIDANEPHAYIQGDIIECMACSDNVVRAGLSCKFKDTETLVKMLSYKSGVPRILRGERLDTCTTAFIPPIDDFAIEIINIPAGSAVPLKSVQSPSLVLVVEGSGRLNQFGAVTLDVAFGKAAFMSANTSATVVTEDGQGITIIRALSNVYS